MSDNKILALTSLLAIVLSLTAIFLVMSNSWNQTLIRQENSQDVLSVSGESETSVEPDKADVFIRIETRNQDAQNAQNDNRKRSNSVRQALMDEGIGKKDMETTQYSLQRIEEYNRETREQEFKGYKQVHVLKVTTSNLEKIGTYIDVSVEAGANGIDHVNFDLSKETKETIRNNVLKTASEQASSKAQALARSLGVELGHPVRISESRFDYRPYRSNMETAQVKRQSDGGPNTQVSPEKVEVSAGVSVDYRINAP